MMRKHYLEPWYKRVRHPAAGRPTPPRGADHPEHRSDRKRHYDQGVNNMTNKSLTILLAALLALIIGGGAIWSVAQTSQPAANPSSAPAAEEQLPYPEGGGTLILRVNPEFAIHYDAQGKVVGIDELNDDARAMGIDLAAYEGQECRAVVSALVTKINEAGYFVEEVEGEGPQTIGIEVEKGSSLPTNDFLRNIVQDSQSYIVGQQMSVPTEVTGTSNYGWTDYSDSDYGPDNDGVTDYNDSDYGPFNDGATEYQAPAPAPAPSGGGSSSGGGASSGASSSSGSSSGGSSSAPAPAPAPAPSGGGGNSGYSGYDSNSGYEGNSGHDNSGYDD